MEPKMPTQRDLDFMDAEKAREARRLAASRETFIDRNILAVVVRLGHKHFADKMGLGVEKKDRVYHWTERRNGQRPPAELLMDVHEEDLDALNEYLDALGCEPTRRKLPVQGDKLAHALMEELRGFGERGEQSIERAQRQAAKSETPDWARTTPLKVAAR